MSNERTGYIICPYLDYNEKDKEWKCKLTNLQCPIDDLYNGNLKESFQFEYCSTFNEAKDKIKLMRCY